MLKKLAKSLDLSARPEALSKTISCLIDDLDQKYFLHL